MDILHGSILRTGYEFVVHKKEATQSDTIEVLFQLNNNQNAKEFEYKKETVKKLKACRLKKVFKPKIQRSGY